MRLSATVYAVELIRRTYRSLPFVAKYCQSLIEKSRFLTDRNVTGWGRPNIRAAKCKVSSRPTSGRYVGGDFPSTR